MSAFQLRTMADLVAAVREEMGISATDTTAVNRIKRDLNIVYAEVKDAKRWWWLNGNTTLQLPPLVSTGTASVTNGASTVTLSTSILGSRKGWLFAVDGYNEIYPIETHASGTGVIQLSDTYTGQTNTAVTYKIWTDRVALPTDCKETSSVWHDHMPNGLDAKGLKDFRRISAMAPRREGKPIYYSTGDYVDPVQTSQVAALPALATRASSGMVKTLVFSATLPAAIVARIQNGDPVNWMISGASEPSYNGPIYASAVSTTTASNDTITYIGRAALTEAAVSDPGLVVTQINQEVDYARYREMYLYPALTTSRVTLHVDYVKETTPLENDSDEPIIPLEDRVVLLYGTLHRSWSKQRNPEEASRNYQLYQAKLTAMEGKLQDTYDTPKLRPSKIYLNAKRNQVRGGSPGATGAFGGGGGGGGASEIAGTPNTAVVFDASGRLAPVALVPNRFVTANASGILTSTSVPTTTVAYLTDNEALTSVTLADNASGTVASWAAASFNSIQLVYSMARGAGNVSSGTINIISDGTNAAMAQGAEAQLGSLGVTLSVDVSSGNVRLLYLTSATGTPCTLKYKVQKWITA